MNSRKKIKLAYSAECDEAVELKWDFETGMKSFEKAKKRVRSLGCSDESFVYIRFLGQFYAVSLTPKGGVVIKNSKCYVVPLPGFGPIAVKELPDAEFVPSFSGSLQNAALFMDMKEFDPHTEIICPVKMAEGAMFMCNCLALLGAVSFRSFIPVFLLDSVSKYFIDALDSNFFSVNALLEKNIVSLNPFSQKVRIRENDNSYRTYCINKDTLFMLSENNLKEFVGLR